MKTFNEAISLRVIGCGGLMMNIEKGTKGSPERGSKLWATVRSNDGWHTKS
jgi:hypothetical protein